MVPGFSLKKLGWNIDGTNDWLNWRSVVLTFIWINVQKNYSPYDKYSFNWTKTHEETFQPLGEFFLLIPSRIGSFYVMLHWTNFRSNEQKKLVWTKTVKSGEILNSSIEQNWEQMNKIMFNFTKVKIFIIFPQFPN